MRYVLAVFFLTAVVFNSVVLPQISSGRIRGTLVIAVPVRDGLVVCADKRLYNMDARTFTDTNVKIRRAGPNALFVATNIVGIYDNRTRSLAFDASRVVEDTIRTNGFRSDPLFWQALRLAIKDALQKYFASHDYAEWPETDKRTDLLFNLLFYTLSADTPQEHVIKVTYHKLKPLFINVSDVTTNEITRPAFSGKGREVIKVIANDKSISMDPLLIRFDERIFDRGKITASDAVDFSEKIFQITNREVPSAHVSAMGDCAALDTVTGFRWLVPESRTGE